MDEDESQTGRILVDVGTVVTALEVVAQTGIENEGVPLVFQLYETIEAILVILADVRDGVGLGNMVCKAMAEDVATIVQREVVERGTIRQIALVLIVVDVVEVAFEICSKCLLLSVEIARKSILAHHLDKHFVRHVKQYAGQESLRTVGQHLIVRHVFIVVGDPSLKEELSYFPAVAEVDMVRLRGKARLDAIVGGVAVYVVRRCEITHRQGRYNLREGRVVLELQVLPFQVDAHVV